MNASIIYKGTSFTVTKSGLIYDSSTGKEIKQNKDSDGYYQINIYTDTKLRTTVKIHRLVALAFLGKPAMTSLQVNHKDGNKENNHPSNLEWCTQRENIEHSFNIGLRDSNKPKMKIIGRAKGITILLNSQADAVKLGFQQSNISKCIDGSRNTHKGFTWEKADESNL